MSYRTSIKSALMLPPLLGLVACSPTLWTRTGATETVALNAADLCKRAWLAISYSSKDTTLTQAEVIANNAARKAYCNE